MIHPEKPDGVVVIGLGKREDFTPERARVAAAIAAQAAAKRKATALAMRGSRRRRSGGDRGCPRRGRHPRLVPLRPLQVEAGRRGGGRRGRRSRASKTSPSSPGRDVGDAVEVARVSSEAANRARELQNLPSNLATPTFLAERALELAVQHDSLSCEVMERDEMVERGMGGLEAVSAGTDEPPKLIVIRHEGDGTADRARRQGRHLRLGRHLDQALGRRCRR